MGVIPTFKVDSINFHLNIIMIISYRRLRGKNNYGAMTQ